MLLIYYNPNHDCFYSKTIHSFTIENYHVGYVNQYNHQIIQMLYIKENKFINCNNYWDYVAKSKKLEKDSINNMIIDKLVCVLYKFKK